MNDRQNNGFCSVVLALRLSPRKITELRSVLSPFVTYRRQLHDAGYEAATSMHTASDMSVVRRVFELAFCMTWESEHFFVKGVIIRLYDVLAALPAEAAAAGVRLAWLLSRVSLRSGAGSSQLRWQLLALATAVEKAGKQHAAYLRW